MIFDFVRRGCSSTRVSVKKIIAWAGLLCLITVLPVYIGRMPNGSGYLPFSPLVLSGFIYIVMLVYIGFQWRSFCINDRWGGFIFSLWGCGLMVFRVMPA